MLQHRKLELVVRRWSLLGIPLPLALAPRSESFETDTQRRFEFSVAIDLPLAGRVVRYTGWVEPTSTEVLGDTEQSYLD